MIVLYFSSLPVLLCTADYVSPSNQVTLTEIIVARLLSLDVESAKQIDGNKQCTPLSIFTLYLLNFLNLLFVELSIITFRG